MLKAQGFYIIAIIFLVFALILFLLASRIFDEEIKIQQRYSNLYMEEIEKNLENEISYASDISINDSSKILRILNYLFNNSVNFNSIYFRIYVNENVSIDVYSVSEEKIKKLEINCNKKYYFENVDKISINESYCNLSFSLEIFELKINESIKIERNSLTNLFYLIFDYGDYKSVKKIIKKYNL